MSYKIIQLKYIEKTFRIYSTWYYTVSNGTDNFSFKNINDMKLYDKICTNVL